MKKLLFALGFLCLGWSSSVSALTFDDVGNALGQVLSGGGQPDLVITSISINPETRVPTVTIKNQGNASALLSGVLLNWKVARMSANGAELPIDDVVSVAPICSSLTGQLSFDAGATMDCFGSPLSNLVSEFRVEVNPAILGVHSIQESNFDNNSFRVMAPAPLTADLVITNISIDEDTRIPNVTLKNQGTGPVFLSGALLSWKATRFDSVGRVLTVDSAVSVAPVCGSIADQFRLAPGASMNCAASPLSNRVHKYRLTVNPATAGVRAITESNYGNNTMTVTAPEPKIADLVITGISINEDTRIPKVTVKNQGNGTVMLSGALLSWKISKFDAASRALPIDDQISVAPVCMDLGAMVAFAPGASMDCVGSPLSNKVAKYRATVNPGVNGVYAVGEKNYANNTLTVTAPEPKRPDLVITGISINEDTRVPTVTVKNDGTAPLLMSGLSLGWKQVRLDAKGRTLQPETAASSVLACDNAAAAVQWGIGEVTTCTLSPLSNAVSKLRVTVNPPTTVAKVQAYAIEERKYANNSFEVIAPKPLLPDLSLESISFGDGEYPLLTVKNVGTRKYPSGSIVFASTVTNAYGKEIPSTPTSLISNVCVTDKDAAIEIGESRTCEAKMVFTRDAKRLKISLAAVRIGAKTTFQGEELGILNNTRTVELPPLKMPDLALEQVYFGDGGFPRLSIKNVGTKAYPTDLVQFAVTVTDATGRELVASSLNMAGEPCFLHGPLAVGASDTCQIRTPVDADAKTIKVTILAQKVGPNLTYVGEELSRANNTASATIVPKPKVDLELVGIDWNDGKWPILTIKNVGDMEYSSDSILFAATVTDANGNELVLSSMNIASEPCYLHGRLAVGATDTCSLRLTMNTDAARLKITLASMKVGRELQYLGEEKSRENNTKTVDVPSTARITPGMAIQGPSLVQMGQSITLKAMLTTKEGVVSQYTDGIWSVRGLGGRITQDGVYTAPAVRGHDTVVYTYTDENGVWTEATVSILVQ